jgi:uncharacterized protein YbjT (DUF2867 family)
VSTKSAAAAHAAAFRDGVCRLRARAPATCTARTVILVTGASGFVGGHIVRALAAAGERVRAMIRDLAGAQTLEDVECEVVRGDMTDPASLREAVTGCTTVVHVVAILAGKPSDFERVMTQGSRDLLAAARDAGVARWVQMSALGTTQETKDLVPYYRAKWETEQAVAGSGLAHVILRPSFVLGPDGGIIPRFARIARLAPITPIVGPGTQRLQPIWVDDLAAIVARCAQGAESGLLQLGGPEIVDWNEFWARLKVALGTRRPTIHLPFWFMRPQAFVLERLPNPPLTRDQLTMLAAGDNVAEPNDSLRFGPELALVPLDEQLRRALRSD